MLADGLGVLSTAIAAFVFVLSIPIPAAVASYVYEGTAGAAPASSPRAYDDEGVVVDGRLRRHLR
jgi:hypothetical protein